jgi:hypothetical protein
LGDFFFGPVLALLATIIGPHYWPTFARISIRLCSCLSRRHEARPGPVALRVCPSPCSGTFNSDPRAASRRLTANYA